MDEHTAAAIIERIPPVAIGPWRWMDTRFYAGQGVFMFTQGGGEYGGKSGCMVWLGAKTKHPLQFLKPYVDDSRDYVVL